MNAHRPATGRQLKRSLEEASGYMELGMPADADEVLAALPDEIQSHPGVMSGRIGALLAAGSWEPARQIAARLTDCMEEHPRHWIWWAYATRRAESVEVAEAILERALDEHPEVAMIHYNLACYAAVQGRVEEARRRLNQAAAIDPEMGVLALDDPDLQDLGTAK